MTAPAALTPFPVDAATLDDLSAAADPRSHGQPDADHSRLFDYITALDPQCGIHDVVQSLITEVRRLRVQLDAPA